MLKMHYVHHLLVLLAVTLCACGARTGIDPGLDGQPVWDAEIDAAPQRDGGIPDAYQPTSMC